MKTLVSNSSPMLQRSSNEITSLKSVFLDRSLGYPLHRRCRYSLAFLTGRKVVMVVTSFASFYLRYSTTSPSLLNEILSKLPWNSSISLAPKRIWSLSDWPYLSEKPRLKRAEPRLTIQITLVAIYSELLSLLFRKHRISGFFLLTWTKISSLCCLTPITMEKSVKESD